LGNSTAFTRYPLWIAHYTTGSPKIPGGWRTWTFWQRTSSGSVSGISGHVDLHRFNGTSAQLAKLANSTGGSSAPPPSGPTLPVGAATSLTSTPSATSVAIDQVVPFSGMLRTTSPVAPVAGRTVSLWSRHVGSSTWNHKGDVVTDSAGHYRLDARVRTTADYQMRWVGGSRYAASASPLVRMTTPAKTPMAVDLHKEARTVLAGAALTLFGHVTTANGGVAGRTVSYYKRVPGASSWTLVGRSSSLAPTGWHSLVVRPMITREWKVVANSSDVYTRATSSYLTIRPR
ncbi:MAG: GH25 family lysozyme, partial [Propionibacteriaceae bacterium]